MRRDVEAATARVIAIRARVADLGSAAAPVQEVEDGLCVGYAQALEADAWLSALERRLQSQLHDASPGARDESRALAVEHAELRSWLVVLREELADLRREYERLRGHAPVRAH